MNNIINKSNLTALSILTAFLFTILPITAGAQQKFISIGTGGVTGVYYPTEERFAVL